MKKFDPWTATEEEAVRFDEELTQKSYDEGRQLAKTGRYFQDRRHFARRLLVIKDDVERGNKFLAHAAIDYCIRHELPIPDWLLGVFERRYEDVLALQGRVEENDGRAVMDGIVACLESGLLPPAWLRSAFLRRYYDVVRYKYASWDDVFEKPHPRSAKLPQHRHQHEVGFAVFSRALELLREPSPPTKLELEYALADEFGLSRKVVTRYIESVEDQFSVSLNDKSE